MCMQLKTHRIMTVNITYICILFATPPHINMDNSTTLRNLVTSSITSLSTSFTNILNNVRPNNSSSRLPRPASTTSLKDWQLPPQYRPIRMLGKGAMGKVWLCEHTITGKQVALKLLRRPVPDALLINLQQEITVGFCGGFDAVVSNMTIRHSPTQLHTMLDHPNVVPIHALHITPTHVIIVMDALLGGTMLTYVQQSTTSKGALCISEAQASALFKVCGWVGVHFVKEHTCISHQLPQQVLLALQHCHERGIAHRDVKLENLLLTDDTPIPTVCLCDFGFATSTTMTVTHTNTLHYGYVY